MTLPFHGELMTCIMCGKQQGSDPKIESQWRLLEVDGVRYYACPAEFPPDTAEAEAFKAAYLAIFTKIMSLRRRPNGPR